MARRLALSLRMLREIHPSACDTDARVLMKDGDEFNLSIKTKAGTFNLSVCSTRELRLLAKQLEWFADHIDRDPSQYFEEFEP